jgi:hypothetical protein
MLFNGINIIKMSGYYYCSYRLSNEESIDFEQLVNNLQINNTLLCMKNNTFHKCSGLINCRKKSKYFHNCVYFTLKYYNKFIKILIFKNGSICFDYKIKEGDNIYLISDDIMNLLCNNINTNHNTYTYHLRQIKELPPIIR